MMSLSPSLSMFKWWFGESKCNLTKSRVDFVCSRLKERTRHSWRRKQCKGYLVIEGSRRDSSSANWGRSPSFCSQTQVPFLVLPHPHQRSATSIPSLIITCFTHLFLTPAIDEQAAGFVFCQHGCQLERHLLDPRAVLPMSPPTSNFNWHRVNEGFRDKHLV
ncbi:hypothetical protein SCHPADRAFT_380047 [Schizopora paradoxa]|uniref:Uncharacterized protein n=1 Tax=Schizopora paradoxa TaxID=27342 RepID=A0A0H2RMH0_9AGAM|nr:hypothetical protein SCHPADRAFT_380047 [Schizopora paradoxa]